MYYYYYYYLPECKQFNIKLVLNNENEKFDLTELLNFLNAISELHKRAIFVTQPEYKNDNSLDIIDNRVLLSYHSFQIEKIEMNSPLTVSLSFFCLPNELTSYLILFKYLMKICKKYGKNDKHLKQTIEKIIEQLYKFDPFIKYALRHHNLNKTENSLGENSSKYDSLILKVENVIKEFLTNKKCIKLYNLICRTAIRIDEILIYDNDENEIFPIFRDKEEEE